MRINKPPSARIDKHDVVKAVEMINLQVLNYLEDLDVLQKKLEEDFVEEFGENGLIDVLSQAKFARLTSKFCHYQAKSSVRKTPRRLEAIFDIWLKQRKQVFGLDPSKQKKMSIAPAKLSFIFFYNGELVKALVCIMDYCELAPDDHGAKEIALKWLLYLGETELIEKKMKLWNAPIPFLSTEFVQMTEKFLKFVKVRESRGETLTELIEIADNIKKNAHKSFHSYELVSTSSWILSILGNVAASTGLENKKFPDRASHLVTAAGKAESVIKNKVEGLYPYQFDNTYSSSVFNYLESSSGSRSATEYLIFGSGIAWMFELRNELVHVYINSAQAREAQKELILNWRVTLKSCSFMRILQSVNMMHYYWRIVTNDNAEMYRNLLSATTVNMLSPDAMIVRCSTPLEESETQADQTMMITDGINDLSIAGTMPIHSISKTCFCFTCALYLSSSNMAAEYMFSWMMYFNFSQQAMFEFEKTFVKIRENTITYQRLIHGDDLVRPRPPITLSIVFSICAIRWLSSKVANKEKYDESTKKLIEGALKISRYIGNRGIDLMLTLQQLNRQLQSPRNMNLSWMQPVDRRPFLRMSIESAVDIIRAVSPFGSRKKISTDSYVKPESAEVVAKLKQELAYDMIRYNHTLNREWRSQMFTYIGRTTFDPWEAGFTWMESTSIGTRNSLQQKLGMSGSVTISSKHKFRACVESMPDDMTIVQIAKADDGNIYMIKLHSDRDPIVMPIAHETQMSEMMKKFTHLLMEDERISTNPGKRTVAEFWDTRRAIDARVETLVDEIQKNFLGPAAYFLLPSIKLGLKSTENALKIEKFTRGAIKLGEAKELVYLTTKMKEPQWFELLDRYGELRKISEKEIKSIRSGYKVYYEAVRKDLGRKDSNKYYTYLNICPDLAQFCWEHLPIFENHLYVCRVISIHALFCQLDSLRDGNKEIPLQIDVQKAYYILDPENNLGETQKRILEYIQKFQWEGTVGETPTANDVSVALEKKDAFFFFGHGSGSKHLSRHTIKKSKCNAVSLLMGCGSVKTIPQGIGFDGKSVLLDYVVAKCPLVVGCLWTVTDGEIDRYLMRMIDDCFVRDGEGGDKLRQLAEAMDTARSKARLKYLTGASVVMYGLPVVSKPEARVVTSVSEEKVKQKVADFNKKVLENTTNDLFVECATPVAVKTPRTPSRSRKPDGMTPKSQRVLRSSRKNSANK